MTIDILSHGDFIEVNREAQSLFQANYNLGTVQLTSLKPKTLMNGMFGSVSSGSRFLQLQ